MTTLMHSNVTTVQHVHSPSHSHPGLPRYHPLYQVWHCMFSIVEYCVHLLTIYSSALDIRVYRSRRQQIWTSLLTYRFRLNAHLQISTVSLCKSCYSRRHRGCVFTLFFFVYLFVIRVTQKKLLNQFSQNSVEGWHMEWTTELADDFSGNLGRCVRFMVTAISK